MDQTFTTENHYMFLRADKLQLLMPQDEMSETEHLRVHPEPSGVPGLLLVPGHEEVCFVVLSETFELLDDCPADRYVTTKLVTDEGMETHWCWSEVKAMQDFVPEFYNIPEVLLHTASPLRQFALIDGQPVFLCSGQILQQLFLRTGA